MKSQQFEKSILTGKPVLSYIKWERQVTDTIIDIMDVTNGDAQGIVECYPKNMLLEYNKGTLPEEMASMINNGEFDLS